MNKKYDVTMMLQFAKDNVYSIIPLENEMNIDPTPLKFLKILRFQMEIINMTDFIDKKYK